MIKEIKLEDIKCLFRKRDLNSNKGDFGKAGILGGSIKYSGAVKLANMSLCTLRSGCGLIRVIVPKEIISSVSPYLLEQTLYPYEDLDDIKAAIKDLGALAIGMGWDYEKEHLSILEYVLENFRGKLILDADGLNTLGGHLELLKKSNARIVLTPHLKEFSRLTGLSILEIEQDKINIAKNFAKNNHVILVLKGHTTIVTDGEDVYLERKAGKALLKMLNDVNRLFDNEKIIVSSGYRSIDDQQNVLDHYLNIEGNNAYKRVALPGTSEHQIGLGIDIGIIKNGEYKDDLTGNEEALKWLFENAYKYGFILRYPLGKENIHGYRYEPWHFRYVGLIAKYIKENDLTLEEYVLEKTIK